MAALRVASDSQVISLAQCYAARHRSLLLATRSATIVEAGLKPSTDTTISTCSAGTVQGIWHSPPADDSIERSLVSGRSY